MSEVGVVEATELSQRLGDDNLLLLQITSAEVYQQAHIPGALLVTPQELVCGVPPATGRLPEAADLKTLFDRLGYHAGQQVVVYDDEGGGWAGRMGWTLDCIGHRQWDYLNGGMHGWHQAGLNFEAGPGPEVHATDNTINIDTAPIAEIPDILESLESSAALVWDVRSREEYMGMRAASARLGHIPGAVNYDWLLLKDATQHLNQSADRDLAKIGVDGSKPLITHCQTHHRSGLSYMWGRIKGWDIRAYHGSWSEWGNREDTPIDNPSAAD